MDPHLKRQHEGADQPFELLDGAPRRAVGLRLARRGASVAACSPSFSASPARRSTKAGSSPALNKSSRRCPSAGAGHSL
eukprot:471781-Alexandrium_andersonii.AAC.1